ncbi:MarR family winged helix-turn-helix transcriptional regulator [Leifsonia poae]|uniref:MarR family winged helix-turn-helix transcriptional regulator n=1 Tax=Leifsonia poae TaxID=110933 RepID=UPI001CBD98C7|nr:MarR family winged helix-turn-helix transcriptional regulator [Leifsonia poae]
MSGLTLVSVESDARRDAVGSVEDSISRLMRSVRTTMADNASAFDPELQPSAYAIMSVVNTKCPVAPAVIIELTGMDKSSVSRQLRILKDSGYITSEPDPDDRRADLYSPTPEAGARFAAIRAANRERFGNSFDGWEEHEVVEFAALLERFIRPATGEG